MQRSESRLGCLHGRIDRVGDGLSGEVRRLSAGLHGRIDRVGDGLSGYVSLVCTVNRDSYLNISTNELWLTPEMLSEEFEIYSNANWKIE